MIQQNFTFLVCVLGMNAAAFCQLAPEIGYAHPAGMKAGTSTEITLGGYDWTPDTQLFAHDPRVQIEILGPPTQVLISEPPYWFGAKARGYAWPLPREFRARVTVPADVPVGLIRWQAANANGVSPVAVFHISDFPEVVEAADHASPQLLPPLPVAVSGQIRRIEEVDRYRIVAPRTGLITIELMARKLTAPANPMALHGILNVHDDTGRQVVDVAAVEGNDLMATFAVEEKRQYEISLHDLDFAGDRSYVYRLLISSGPAIVATYPAAGKRGETRSVKFVGWGLATGTNQLEAISHDVAFPNDPTLDSFAFQVETPFGKTRPYPLGLSDHPEFVEGNAITDFPIAVTGSLDTKFGSDTHQVQWKKGDVWQISARSRKAGLPLDLDLTVQNAEGKDLSSVDDISGSTDPELVFTVPQDGNYRLVISDRSGQSGNRAACYRLTIEPVREDFSLTLPDFLSVPIGATAKLPIAVTRRGGFKGPVSLAFEGLPRGLTIPADLVIPAEKANLDVEFTCTADAAASAGLVRLNSSATLNGSNVTLAGKKLVIAAIMKPRIKITPEGLDDVSKVHRGSTHLFPLQIERLEGFTGEIILEMTAKQQRHRQGLAGDEFVIAPDVKRVEYPIFVPEWMETTKTSRMILNGAVRVTDPQGNLRTLLQRMELRLGILPEGALMKLSRLKAEYHTTAGSELTIPLTIATVPEFRETVRVELVPSEAQAGLITAEPMTLTPGETTASLSIRLTRDDRLIGDQQLQFRAIAQRNGKWLVKSETSVSLEVRQ